LEPYRNPSPYSSSAPPQSNWPPAPAPVGAYPPPAPALSGLAIASFVMAVLGLIGVPILCSILAIVFGNMAIQEIDRTNGRITGRGLARAGMITGYVTLALIAVGLVVAAAVVIIPHVRGA
jgi:hypothetical protein